MFYRRYMAHYPPDFLVLPPAPSVPEGETKAKLIQTTLSEAGIWLLCLGFPSAVETEGAAVCI